MNSKGKIIAIAMIVFLSASSIFGVPSTAYAKPDDDDPDLLYKTADPITPELARQRYFENKRKEKARESGQNASEVGDAKGSQKESKQTQEDLDAMDREEKRIKEEQKAKVRAAEEKLRAAVKAEKEREAAEAKAAAEGKELTPKPVQEETKEPVKTEEPAPSEEPSPSEEPAQNAVAMEGIEDDLFIGALNKTGEDSYNLKKVEKGTIKRQTTTDASVYCPNFEYVKVPANLGKAIFKEMLVKEGDNVKKGTPLVRISTSIDEITYKQQNMNLNRLQEDYDNYVRTQNNGLQEQKKALDKMTDNLDKQIASIEYEKAKLNFEKSKADQEKQMETVKKEIEQSKVIKDTKEICASIDGYVENVITPAYDAEIENSGYLVKIVDTSVVYLKINDDSDEFQYNMNVTLAVNPTENGSERTFTGKIVSFSMMEGEDDTEVKACYVKPDEKISYNELIEKEMNATVDECVMDNTLIIPFSAADTGTEICGYNMPYWAYELLDGKLIKRKLLIGVENDEYLQVLMGLKEGAMVAH